jgi:hypothetical protein
MNFVYEITDDEVVFLIIIDKQYSDIFNCCFCHGYVVTQRFQTNIYQAFA